MCSPRTPPEGRHEEPRSGSSTTELGIEPGLEEDQAWYARNEYRLGPGDYDYEALFGSTRQYFVGDGWEVEDYQGPGTIRVFLAFKDDIGVLVQQRPIRVLVTAGPCGRSSTQTGSQFTRLGG